MSHVLEEEEEEEENPEPDRTIGENLSTDNDKVLTSDVKLSEYNSVYDSESYNKDEDKDPQKEDP